MVLLTRSRHSCLLRTLRHVELESDAERPEKLAWACMTSISGCGLCLCCATDAGSKACWLCGWLGGSGTAVDCRAVLESQYCDAKYNKTPFRFSLS